MANILKSIKLSKIGLGTQRFDCYKPSSYDALTKILTSTPVNFIDTSASYTGGESEQLIGQVFKKLITDEKQINRENLLLCTKIGCVQGDQLAALQSQEDCISNLPKNLLRDSIQMSETFVSCISPDYMEFELNQSIQRLNGFNPDVVLLHNPEYFLIHSLQKGLQNPEKEFYEEKILKSFEFLEQKVKEGIIKSYGVSTNTDTCLYSAIGDRHSDSQLLFNPGTNLQKLFDYAEKAAQNVWKNSTQESNFKFFQIPFNMIETGGLSDLKLAKKLGLTTVVNRPINAIAPQGFGSGDWGRSSQYFKFVEKKPILPEQALFRNIIRDKLGKNGYYYTLQQMALLVCKSLPCIDVTLSGAREEKYVDDVKKVLEIENMEEDSVLQLLKEVEEVVKEHEKLRR